MHSLFFFLSPVVKQLRWQKELHNFHSPNDFCFVNGQFSTLTTSNCCCPSVVLQDFSLLLRFYWRQSCTDKLCFNNNNFLLLQLIIEGGTAIAIFIRCFADKNGIQEELKRRLYIEFPIGVLATISVKFGYLFSTPIAPILNTSFITHWLKLLNYYRFCYF